MSETPYLHTHDAPSVTHAPGIRVVFGMHCPNAVRLQQAIRTRKEEEQVRKIGEDLAAYDPDFPLKRRHHRKHPATTIVGDHELQNDAESMPASHARSAGTASGEMGEMCPSACPRSPPIAFASRSTFKEAMVQKSPMGKGSSHSRNDEKEGLVDRGIPDEQHQVDGSRGEERGEKSCISRRMRTLSIAFADERNDAVRVQFSDPRGGEIQMSSNKPTSTSRQDESEHAVNSIVAERATSNHTGHSGSSMVGSDRLSDTTWSSSEEGDEGCAPPSGRHSSFGKVDDWEGTGLYGSDDECCIPAHPVATSCPGRVQEVANKSANSTGTRRRSLATTVEGWVYTSRAREQGKTPHRGITAGASTDKVGGVGDGISKGQLKFHTNGGETGTGSNKLRRIRGPRRRISSYGDTEDSLPQHRNLSHTRSYGSPSSQSYVETVQSAQHPTNKTVRKSGGKWASEKQVARGNCRLPVRDDPLYGGDDCTGWQSGRLFPREGKTWEEAQQTRWGGSRSGRAVELDVVPGFGHREEESWVVREFQARVDAARRQEAEEAKR